MNSKQKISLMSQVKQSIIDYLTEEISINSSALKSYEEKADTPILTKDPEIRRMRELETMKLRDRIHELNRHIAVIKRM